MKIVLPDFVDLIEQHEAELKSLGEVTIYNDLPEQEAEIIKRIADAEIITASWVNFSKKIINSNPQLKYIIATAVGYDFIDVDAATAAEIKVINCPTHNAAAVAEYTIGLILAITRKIVAASQDLQQGKWQTQIYIGTELSSKNLTLIGHGTIARKVAQLASNFGMNVSYANSKTSSQQLDELIAHADILSLHLPLTAQTQHLIDERRLNLIKESAYLINTARGAIIDQTALLAALKAKRIAGAALDVFADEPVTEEPNQEILQLAQLDNVVATPHIAYHTAETAVRLGEELIANIKACLQGNPINVVN